jgi:hypothetical protein
VTKQLSLESFRFGGQLSGDRHRLPESVDAAQNVRRSVDALSSR